MVICAFWPKKVALRNAENKKAPKLSYVEYPVFFLINHRHKHKNLTVTSLTTLRSVISSWKHVLSTTAPHQTMPHLLGEHPFTEWIRHGSNRCLRAVLLSECLLHWGIKLLKFSTTFISFISWKQRILAKFRSCIQWATQETLADIRGAQLAQSHGRKLR